MDIFHSFVKFFDSTSFFSYPGIYFFFVKYHRKYLNLNNSLLFFISVGGLDPDFEYDFRVVAVDGDHETPSEAIPVYTYSVMPSGYGAPGGNYNMRYMNNKFVKSNKI